MSIEALNWAFKLPITGPKKAVLIALANYADENGACYPSIQTLCLNSGWAPRAVQAAIAELQALGVILSRDARGGRGKSSDYVLDLTYQPGQTPNGSVNGVPNGASHAPFEPERVHQMHPIDRQKGAPDAPIKSKRVHLTSERVHEMHPNLKEPKKERKEGSECTVRKRTSRARLAPDWQPDEAGREYAAFRNVPIASEVENFRDYHLGRGTLIADCAAAWRTWCTKAVVFAARDAAQHRRQPEFRNGFLASIAEHGFEHASDDDSPMANVLRLNGGRVYGRG